MAAIIDSLSGVPPRQNQSNLWRPLVIYNNALQAYEYSDAHILLERMFNRLHLSR